MSNLKKVEYICGARRPAHLGPRYICTVRGVHTIHVASGQPGNIVAEWKDCPRCGRVCESACADCEVSHG